MSQPQDVNGQGQQLPPQPDPQFIIQAMNEELTRTNDNRLYLMSMNHQKDAQLAQMAAQLSQLGGEVERLRMELAAAQPSAPDPQLNESADVSGPAPGGN